MSANLISLSLLAIPSPDVDTVRRALEAKSDRWFTWLVISSVVVGIGVAFEAWEATVTLKRWYLLRKGKDVEPENETSWAIPAAYIGLVLVIAGVAGEGVFEFLASRADTALRAHDEQILGDVILRAGAAKDSAEAAAKAAARAEDASSTAVLSSNMALTTASGARNEADSFEKDIVSAKDAAAKAEEKLADRALSDDQQKELAIKLVRFAGQEYTVTAYWESLESLGLANRIHGALNDLAKWKYNPVGSKSMMMGGEVGIFIWRHPDADPNTKLAVSSLVSALQSDGLKAEERIQNPTNNPKHNLISINVGSKR